MKKNAKFIIIGLCFLVLFVFLLSCYFYQVFARKNPSIISNLEVSFSDRGEIIIHPDLANDSSLVEPYQFKIKNKGEVPAKYKIVLYDNSEKKNGIPRNDLQYELILNQKVIKTGTLDEIKNDILDSRSVSLQEENSYSLKVWLYSDDDLENKSYNYYLKVVPVIE